jgi:hypothetical protein
MGSTSKMKCPLHVGEGRAGLFDEGSTCIGQLHGASPIASEQMKSKLFFDLSNLLAERRLADAQPLRSTREIKFLGENNDGVQVTYFNPGEHVSGPLS